MTCYLLLIAALCLVGTDAPTPVPTSSPYPTSVSGVPSWTTVSLTVAGAILAVLITVTILCFKKSDNDIMVQMNQRLLEKADV
ncbi:hypothetical protein TVAG_353760 [Trichomonas vaginalis G3]|uniref:Uncharacterized protein n=1 Tax=Trichomonas vaginalis (strain ATCC PRA-98 / G3) TaxID=412133 RepID=A2FDG9_TRIV3|nr:hypothetical protein TVAGG3_0481230 [Trichomonas vaginalis G3]EAX97046.1 hypothetical protein TVAG_353760 [Trichomonas vaginalis G3]KAI5515722.1 hypothetical protein TVAGG3_0481230 [Trichomonas vaginalis G3]|eukprot:XP_001309976.1 hypothetical protein [Trichomonas vaginalis G3]